MSYLVDFVSVSTVGLESSPVADALAGLRANEARYFHNKYKAEFVVSPAEETPELIDYVNRVLSERDIAISSKPLETTELLVEGIRWTYVFYQSGLSVNVLYNLEDPKKRSRRSLRGPRSRLPRRASRSPASTDSVATVSTAVASVDKTVSLLSAIRGPNLLHVRRQLLLQRDRRTCYHRGRIRPR